PLAQIHSLRDQVKADVVMLVVQQPNRVGGLARPYGGKGYAFEAFAVVLELGLTLTKGGYYFAHEFGHVMGSEHDDAPGGAFPYSRGMRISRGGGRNCLDWGTIMAHPVCATCEPLLLWSNPKLPPRCGQAPGERDQRDNARSMN